MVTTTLFLPINPQHIRRRPNHPTITPVFLLPRGPYPIVLLLTPKVSPEERAFYSIVKNKGRGQFKVYLAEFVTGEGMYTSNRDKGTL